MRVNDVYGFNNVYSTNHIDVAYVKKNLFCTLYGVLKLVIFHSYMNYKC